MSADPLQIDQTHTYRPRVSRETRMLLTTALVAIVALWVLARVRFPDRPAPQNPVQPLLTQLTPRPTFADLAAEIAALRPRLDPLLVAVRQCPGCASGTMSQSSGLIRRSKTRRRAELLFRYDRASGLSLMRVARRSAPPPALWSPRLAARDTSSHRRCRRPASRFDRSTWPRLRRSTVRDGRDRSGSSRSSPTSRQARCSLPRKPNCRSRRRPWRGRALVPAATVLAEAARLLGRHHGRGTSASTCSRSRRHFESHRRDERTRRHVGRSSRAGGRRAQRRGRD